MRKCKFLMPPYVDIHNSYHGLDLDGLFKESKFAFENVLEVNVEASILSLKRLAFHFLYEHPV